MLSDRIDKVILLRSKKRNRGVEILEGSHSGSWFGARRLNYATLGNFIQTKEEAIGLKVSECSYL